MSSPAAQPGLDTDEWAATGILHWIIQAAFNFSKDQINAINYCWVNNC